MTLMFGLIECFVAYISACAAKLSTHWNQYEGLSSLNGGETNPSFRIPGYSTNILASIKIRGQYIGLIPV